MPNLHKVERNSRIVSLHDGGRGLTIHEIALQLGMKDSAVSMVLVRDRQRREKEEQGKEAER